MADLLINGKDAYITWGVRMGEGVLDVLGAPSPMKEFIENKLKISTDVINFEYALKSMDFMSLNKILTIY